MENGVYIRMAVLKRALQTNVKRGEAMMMACRFMFSARFAVSPYASR
jgi:hypothetical protein